MTGRLSAFIGKFNEKKHSLKKNTENRSSDDLTDRIMNPHMSFSVTEAYKSARTNLIFALADIDRCKRIIFTSAEPSEGKTTTILNMAITFAQTGTRTLLIDGDLRKPRIHRYLQIEKDNGLSDVLAGLISADDAIKHVEDKNLDCITAGQIPPNPAELLSSSKMEKLLDLLSGKYDYIFIDSPPVTVVTDAPSMAKFVDGYVLVVRQNYSIYELLEKTRDSLKMSEAKILGYIINDIKPMAGIGYGTYGGYKRRYNYRYRYRYGYKYGYKYGYGYGYGYQYADRRDNAYSDEYVYGDEVERREEGN